jgi:hypothetical protein
MTKKRNSDSESNKFFVPGVGEIEAPRIEDVETKVNKLHEQEVGDDNS